MNADIITSFLAGFLSFLSPCVFPLIPAYISYISGISIKDLSNSKISINTIFNLLSFIFGFSLIFIFFGASATFIGQLLSQNKIIISKFASLIIIIFGLNFIGIFRIKKDFKFHKFIKFFSFIFLTTIVIFLFLFFKNWFFLAISIALIIIFNYFNLINFDFLNYEKKLNYEIRKTSLFSSFILGSSFAFGWTPCIGPILASILTLAAVQETVYQGIVLLTFYSLGLAVPFFISGILVDFLLKSIKNFRRFFGFIEFLSGLLLILIGILIYNNAFTMIASLFSR